MQIKYAVFLLSTTGGIPKLEKYLQHPIENKEDFESRKHQIKVILDILDRKFQEFTSKYPTKPEYIWEITHSNTLKIEYIGEDIDTPVFFE